MDLDCLREPIYIQQVKTSSNSKFFDNLHRTAWVNNCGNLQRRTNCTIKHKELHILDLFCEL